MIVMEIGGKLPTRGREEYPNMFHESSIPVQKETSYRVYVYNIHICEFAHGYYMRIKDDHVYYA